MSSSKRKQQSNCLDMDIIKCSECDQVYNQDQYSITQKKTKNINDIRCKECINDINSNCKTIVKVLPSRGLVIKPGLTLKSLLKVDTSFESIRESKTKVKIIL
jgi:hypothetical protein